MEKADGEVVFQTKVRRKDVYDAVRNLLINEFKVIPEDLNKAIDQKLDNRMEAVLDKLFKRYGIDSRLQKRIDSKMADLEKKMDGMTKEAVVAEVKRLIAESSTSKLLEKIFKE